MSKISESNEESYEKVVDKLLEDPVSESWMLQKLGLNSKEETGKEPTLKKKDDEEPQRDPPDHQMG